MTVYVVHAPGDAAVAEKIARMFEREGAFVETEDGGRPFAPLMGRDLVALVWTPEAAAIPALTDRALDAWAVDRLLLAVLDGAPPPPIFADLPRLDVAAGAAPGAIAHAASGRLAALAPLDPKAPAVAPPPASSAPPRVDRLATARRMAMGSALSFVGAGLCAAAWAGTGAPALDPAAPFATPTALSAPVALALGGLGLVQAVAAAALAAGAPRAAPPPPTRAVILAGDAARCAALAPALAAEGVGATTGDDMRAALAEADGVVLLSVAGALDGPALRATHLARRAGKPVVVLRDTPAAAGSIIAGAPNAAWPGEPRAAAALALSLIDAAHADAARSPP